MKLIKSLIFLVPFLILLFPTHSFADDTDLYVGGSGSVEPNILIIFDKSGSMNSPPEWNSYCEYDPGVTYDPISGKTLNPGTVYKQDKANWASYSVFKSSISGVGCSLARDGLTYNGYYSGYTNPAGTPKSSSKECTANSYVLATGNYLRWYFAVNAPTNPCPKKIDIAKKVIKNFISTINGVKIGIMTFNDTYDQSDDLWCDWGDTCPEINGGHMVKDIVTVTENQTNRDALKTAIDNLSADGYTPLAETLHEAGLYFQGANSYFNSGTKYTSPINPYCQKNYVILMTDGISTCDRNSILRSIGTNGDTNIDQREPPGAANDPVFGENGSDHLDDVAKYLYDTDLRPDLKDKQNIVTYTIGFEIDMDSEAEKAKDLLERTANLGHGKFYPTSGAGGLADAFSNIINEVLAKTSSFVAPIVPVSRMERTTAGDKIYLAFFKPNQTGMWSGNIKKYGVAQTKDPLKGIEVGDVLDATGSKAIDPSNGEFYASSKSFWTTSSSDGGEVEAGGVGEILKNRDFTSNPRKIYSYYTGCTTELKTDCNAFSEINWSKLSAWLGTSGETETKKLINFIRGIDVYDDNANGETTDKRDWLLGSFLHSRPAIINYPDRTVIYSGANDGMLHAFLDSEKVGGTWVERGEELWAYIPGSLLGNLKLLHTDNPPIFVDGSPKAYVSYESDGVTVKEAILIFGLRRGGTRYYALDVKDPLNPKFAWHIDNDISGYSTIGGKLGQSWSTPNIAKVKVGTEEKSVAFIGGGYDTNQDLANPNTPDVYGTAVYVVNVLNGSLVKRFSHADGYGDMDYCIPSDITKLDIDGNGYVDRLYVGDMHAQMWRIGYDGSDPSVDKSDVTKWTARVIFKSYQGASDKRRIFYPPDVTLEADSTGNYEMLFFGTGDREDPKGIESYRNKLYAIKDRSIVGSPYPLQDSDLVDVTLDKLQDPSVSQAEKDTILSNLRTKYGWNIELSKRDGEKCLAPPLAYYKTVYFTTFNPTAGEVAECDIGEGEARLYALQYDTGNAVFNYDSSTEGGGTALRRSDRSTRIGTAIASGVVITVIGGKVTAYIGVGGGIHSPELTTRKSLIPMQWKLVF